MSVLQKALDDCGLQLEGDKLPKKQRQQRVFQRVIAAIRAAEAKTIDDLAASEREANEAHKRNLELLERVRELEAQLLRSRLKEGMEQIQGLTMNDRSKLLDLSSVGNGSH